jgi:hypothetical protein
MAMERYELHGAKVYQLAIRSRRPPTGDSAGALFSITAPHHLQALRGHMHSGMLRMASHSLSRIDPDFLPKVCSSAATCFSANLR